VGKFLIAPFPEEAEPTGFRIKLKGDFKFHVAAASANACSAEIEQGGGIVLDIDYLRFDGDKHWFIVKYLVPVLRNIPESVPLDP
jgi:hypothetical protein